jgi:hypothetical protein
MNQTNELNLNEPMLNNQRQEIRPIGMHEDVKFKGDKKHESKPKSPK